MSALADAVDELRENERQWDAFSTPGHCAVLAPPGSGKTKLLTTRLAYDLASDRITRPQGAGCITMTNEAAAELRQRLRVLGTPRRANLFVGTVHAFALSRIIGPFAGPAGLTELAEARLASDEEQRQIFAQTHLELVGRPDDDGVAKATMGKARRLLDYTGDRLLGGEVIATLARQYENNLAAAGLYDFDDLIRHAVVLVEGNEWLRRILAAAYPGLYVDEYQDLPPGLDRLVRALCFDEAANATLFAVGDPDQSIYGFIGTRPEMLHDLAERHDVSAVQLDLNYRCGQDIVDASLRALGREPGLRGAREGGVIEVHRCRDDESQRQRALELVQAAHEDGRPWDQICVLTPWGAARDAAVETLRQAGVPTFARSDKHYRPTPVTMLVEAAGSYAAHGSRAGVKLDDLLDSWSAITPGASRHEDLTEVVALLQASSESDGASSLVEGLTTIGFHHLADDPGASEDGRALEKMRGALRSDAALAALSIGDLGDRARALGRVMAATIHGVKGLEFDVVVILDVEEGRLPDFRNTDPVPLAEERRKFYVSLTRARESVHLLYPKTRVSRKGRPYEPGPSRFIRTLTAS